MKRPPASPSDQPAAPWCQQAPVSNEFSTTVPFCSEVETYSFSAALTPVSVTVGLWPSILHSPPPLPLTASSLTLLVYIYCLNETQSFLSPLQSHLALPSPAAPPCFLLLALRLSAAGSVFRQTGIQMSLHAANTSSLIPYFPFMQVSNTCRLSPWLCRLPGRAACLICARGVDKRLAVFAARRRHRWPRPEIEQSQTLSYNEGTILSRVSSTVTSFGRRLVHTSS